MLFYFICLLFFFAEIVLSPIYFTCIVCNLNRFLNLNRLSILFAPNLNRKFIYNRNRLRVYKNLFTIPSEIFLFS